MPKIGNALKTAVERRPEAPGNGGRRAKPTSALMNPNRRKIFQHLCRAPCSRLGSVARATGLSRSSAKWHLEKLSRSGYVQVFLVEGEPHYCPQGLVPGRNFLLFTVLARRNNMAVYRAVLKAPGSDAGMIASSTGLAQSMARGCLAELTDMELLTRTSDGRYVRFFPTERYNDAAREDAMVRGKFVTGLVRRLASEHLAPDIDDLKGPDIVINITVLGQRESIVVPQQMHAFN